MKKYDVAVTDPTCFDIFDGAIDLTFSDGADPYEYQWSNGANTEDIEGLSGGNYEVTITDANNQDYLGQWDLIDPQPIILELTSMGPFCHPNNGPLDGVVDAFAIGGTEIFSFLWSGPDVTGANNNILNGLGSGTYEVTVTDENGCSAVSAITLDAPSEIVIDPMVQNIGCVDGQSQLGSIDLNVTGGDGLYLFFWDGDVSDPSGESQQNLEAGTYSVTVGDVNNCTIVQSFEISGVISDPIEVSISSIGVGCEDGLSTTGKIQLNVFGGTPPYTYNWTGNGVDPNTQNQENLNVGLYLVTISDSEECQMLELEIELQNEILAAPSLCVITNDNLDGYNTLFWEDPENLTGVDQYNIYREGSIAEQFDLIDSLDFGPDNFFFDTDANSTQQAYRYYVTSANSCGYESVPSSIHKTIHLTINQGSFGNINLIWDEYEGVEYDQVAIYKGETPSTMEIYEVLPGNVFSYTDDNALEEDAYYQVVITAFVECNIGHAFIPLKSNIAGFLVNSVNDADWLNEIYPNPFVDEISLDLKTTAIAEILDVRGNKVSDHNLTKGLNIIFTNNLPSGIYIVRIISNGATVIWRGTKGN